MLLMLLQLIEPEKRPQFEAFYAAYSDFVMHICFEKLKDYHLAEENAQEVFLTLARNFDKIKDIDSEETRGYVYTVANSHAINKFKKEVVRRLPESQTASFDDIPDQSLNLFSVLELKTAIESLTPEEKAYFRLSVICGFSSKEIGRIFHESASNVRMKMQKIRKKLKERLGEDHE